MANTVDFSKVPALITITNTDLGVVDAAATTAVDKQVTKVYITEPQKRKVQFYRTNFFEELEPGDSLKIIASTSEEASYYKSLEGNFFTVKVEEANKE